IEVDNLARVAYLKIGARSRVEGDSRSDAPTAEGGVSDLSALATRACARRSRRPKPGTPQRMSAALGKEMRAILQSTAPTREPSGAHGGAVPIRASASCRRP